MPLEIKELEIRIRIKDDKDVAGPRPAVSPNGEGGASPGENRPLEIKELEIRLRIENDNDVAGEQPSVSPNGEGGASPDEILDERVCPVFEALSTWRSARMGYDGKLEKLNTRSDVIITERLLIDASSEQLGRDLLPRSNDINRRCIAPVLEQVMDEICVPGLRIRLDKLVVDLGTLSASCLEEAVTNRLREELRRVLAAAVRSAQEDPSPGAGAQSEGEAELDLLEQYLRWGSVPLWVTDPEAFSLEARLTTEIDRGAARLVQLLRRLPGHPQTLQRLTLQLGDLALARLVHVLDAANATLILAYQVNLCALHREEPVVPLSDTSYRYVLWVLVLSYVLRDPGSQFNRKSFVRSLLEGLVDSEDIKYHALLESLGRGLLARSRHLPRRSSLRAVIEEIVGDAEHHNTALRPHPNTVADAVAASPPLARGLGEQIIGSSGRSSRASMTSRDEPGPIFLHNAGLVLTGPFLPHLFHTLDMLAPDDKGVARLRNRETASRAVHIVQSLVDGRTDTREPLLILPKILCGLRTDVPIAREIVLSDAERDISKRLLTAVITHWTAISNTSIAGLRETFIRRDGKLTRGAGRWELRVGRSSLDILVDRIPWSISVLYHPWMLYPIYTTW